MRNTGPARRTFRVPSATKRRATKRLQKQDVRTTRYDGFSNFCDDLESPHLAMNIALRGDAK
jgi:hypothetical protein